MAPASSGEHQSITIPVNGAELPAYLRVPRYAESLAIFVHGSGSSRHSPRNTFVAEYLAEAGFGSLLFDLLTEEEDQIRASRFDVERIAVRLLEVTRWLRENEQTKNLRYGYFGASTGAAAALRVVAELSEQNADYLVRSVVCRGGRPDLSSDYLGSVTVPTLLIVGERDAEVLRLNRTALERLGGEKALETVPNAGHLFREEGAIERVAELTANWFRTHP
jgi:dienelactone hydrolase